VAQVPESRRSEQERAPVQLVVKPQKALELPEAAKQALKPELALGQERAATLPIADFRSYCNRKRPVLQKERWIPEEVDSGSSR